MVEVQAVCSSSAWTLDRMGSTFGRHRIAASHSAAIGASATVKQLASRATQIGLDLAQTEVVIPASRLPIRVDSVRFALAIRFVAGFRTSVLGWIDADLAVEYRVA